jgi:acetyl esterase/lipase
MGLIRALRRWYFAHETRTKAVAFLLFLIVVASLYVIVLRPEAPSNGTALTSTDTSPAPTFSATATAPLTPLPSDVYPTQVPPLPSGTYQVTTQKNLAYGFQSNVAARLDLCTPLGASGLRPGVVLIHGGGFVQGDKNDYETFCTALASHGFVVATVGYRLAPQNKWPAPLEDAQLAVRWMRAHASENQLDPQRLCSMGDSAGGHLATFLGVLKTIYPGDEASLLSDQSPAVSCVVDAFGPIDFVTLNTIPSWQGLFSVMFSQADLQGNPNLLRQASPITYVSAQSAPALVIQGIIDDTVPQSQSQELQQAYQQAGASVAYISYTGGHEYSGLSSQQHAAINQQILSFLTDREHP